MRNPFGVQSVAVVLGVLFFGNLAWGQAVNSTISFGYSHLHLEKTDGLFYNKDGPYIDADLAWKLPDANLPLLVGVGFTGSGYWANQQAFFPVRGGFGTTTLYSDVGLFEIEPRIGITLWAPRSHFFLRPRIGAGLLISSYAVDQIQTVGNTTFFNTQYQTGAAFEVRPNVQAGYSFGSGQVGIEASYMGSWGSYGSFGNWANEFRAGAFFTFRY